MAKYQSSKSASSPYQGKVKAMVMYLEFGNNSPNTYIMTGQGKTPYTPMADSNSYLPLIPKGYQGSKANNNMNEPLEMMAYLTNNLMNPYDASTKKGNSIKIPGMSGKGGNGLEMIASDFSPFSKSQEAENFCKICSVPVEFPLDTCHGCAPRYIAEKIGVQNGIH